VTLALLVAADEEDEEEADEEDEVAVVVALSELEVPTVELVLYETAVEFDDDVELSLIMIEV
jgi:hypothetical protein